MGYYYGDSTDSPFTSNVLEFLRDAIDFSVYALEADRRIRAGRDHVEALRRRAQIELDEVLALGTAVAQAIESTPKGATDSPAARCAALMRPGCDEVVHSVMESVRARLASDIAQAEEAEAAEREACVNALMTLLGTNGPPDSCAVLRVRLRETGGYDAWIDGACAALGLTWKCEMAFTSRNAFEETLRVGRFQQELDVNAPELTGWIRKEVKMRPQHLERYTITEIDREGSKILLRLRTEPGASVGFDVESDVEAGVVVVTRVGDDPIAGPFAVDDADVPKLIALSKSVQKKLEKVTCTRLSVAKLGDVDFRALPTFVDMVERLVGQLAPMVHDIAKHSLEPNELVLRFRLSNDRREEIFVSKSTLREKYEALPNDLSALFEPLGLNAPLSRSMSPVALSQPDDGTKRSELPPSRRPPPPPQAIGRVAVPPAPMPKFWEPISEGESADKAYGAPKARPETQAPLEAIQDVRSKNDEVAGALRNIIELANARRMVDAYRECTRLFKSPVFADCSPEDQRQALKLLVVLGKTAASSEATRDAHCAARDRAQALVQHVGDPADYELMGLCQVSLNESGAAIETFRKGLELEQSRNPQSELCARLSKHVANL